MNLQEITKCYIQKCCKKNFFGVNCCVVLVFSLSLQAELKTKKIKKDMAKEEFTKEMYDKSIEIAMKLTDVLVDEGYSTAFMMYCVARFTAGILSSLQRFCNDVDLATEYTNYVKKMMKDMDAREEAMAASIQTKEDKEEPGKQMMKDVDGSEEAQAASNQTEEDKEEPDTQYLSETDVMKMLMRQVDGKGS